MADQEQAQEPQESLEESPPEAQEQEPSEAPPEDQPPDNEGSDAAESASDETETKSEAPKPDAGQHKRQGGYQRKIDRLERQNQILLEQLQRSGIQPPPVAAPPTNETPEQKAAREFRELVKREAAEEIKAWQQQQQQQEQIAQFKQRTAQARDKYDDWDDAISSLDIPTNSPLGQALLTSDAGPEIMYQLASNPAELARLSALPPWSQAREIGRMEAKASGAAPQTTPSPAKRPPAPPSNVGGSAAKSTRSMETLPLSEYKKAYRSGRR